MKIFTLITAALLCCLSSGSQTVEVQPGGEVTLMCSNISKSPSQTEWFRVVNRTRPSSVSSMFGSSDATYTVGYESGRFKMSTNVSTVFLRIERVDLSDSGLYFCGFYDVRHTVIANATHLNVQGNREYDDEVDSNSEREPDGTTNLMSVILGALTLLLTIVIVALAVKIRKLQKAVNEEPQPERNKNLGSDDLNYASLSFQAKPKRARRPATEREMEPNVVYAATR